MELGDLLAKVGLGEKLTPAEASLLRVRMNSLQALLGLSDKVNPQSGAVSELLAGGVELSNDGIKLLQGVGSVADGPSTLRWIDKHDRSRVIGSVGAIRAGTSAWMDVEANDFTGYGYFNQAHLNLQAITQENSSGEAFYSGTYITAKNSAQGSTYIPFDVWTGIISGDQERVFAIEWDYATRTGSIVPPSTAVMNLGTAANFFADVSYKTITDRGCLGAFDGGVEMPDGKIVSDVEAIKAIKVSDNLETPYGAPRLDYKSMPKAVYKPAPPSGGKDGAEMSALISILLGAIKELSGRIDELESK